MYIHNQQKGQSLVEILFAIAVFTVGVVTIGYLIFDSFASFRYSADSLKARLLAAEGIEAARIIRERDFDELEPGTHGLSFASGTWGLTPSSETIDQFERFIIVEDIDPEVKRITSAVTWGSGIHGKSIAVSTYLSNWQQESGLARDIAYDINDAQRTASGTALSGIAVRNIGEEDILITNIILQWDTEAQLLLASIQGSEVFNASSSVPIQSGETIDITDHEVGSATGFHLMDFSFDGSIENTDVIVTMVQSDGSKKHALVTF